MYRLHLDNEMSNMQRRVLKFEEENKRLRAALQVSYALLMLIMWFVRAVVCALWTQIDRISFAYAFIDVIALDGAQCA